jgi:DNA repair exonuclease SbcCD ATPase subunit
LSIAYDRYKFVNDQNMKNEKEKTKFLELYRKTQVNIANVESNLNSAVRDVVLWKEKIEIANKQKETIEKNKQLEHKIEEISAEKIVTDHNVSVKDDQHKRYLELFGKYKFVLEDAQKKKQEWSVLNDEYAAYDEYIKLTSRDGLPLSIVLSNIDIINQEIASTLVNNGYDFLMYFKPSDDGDIGLFFEKDGITRHLEVASESQKYACSFLIRLALIQICSLPKPSMLWLDETMGCFDGEYSRKFYDLLTYIRSRFSHVFLITHVDACKEISDHMIDIAQEQGISRCYN